MNITQAQKEFIESVIKECTGYRGNEYLLDEFFNEVIRRAYSLISKQNDLDNIRIYIKRIATAVILEIVKKSNDMPLSVKQGSDNEIKNEPPVICYEFDENGDIRLNYEISFDETSDMQESLSQEQINCIKNIIVGIEEKNQGGFYKDIFEMRYSNSLNNSEIADKLELSEYDVDKKLLFMLDKVKKEVFS